ncbi:pyrroloquinoline quinone precursor peptide PqqA [Cohnella zeiphila]|uniref:Coenzyme PQQ synthesis protein A n=1 Tax=Cohnella zeiphila TaxID=2761120 RepID=A0A7X0SWH0_9BACL|nr:pyrroloquinoline quinone precursor peptide PqqA [Cohnella zeiphila]
MTVPSFLYMTLILVLSCHAACGLMQFVRCYRTSENRHKHIKTRPLGGESMWVKPDFEVIEVCAEVTAYAYQK